MIKSKKWKFCRMFLAAALSAMILAGCGSSSSAGTVTEGSDGTYTAEESAECDVIDQGLSYDINLKVTTDSDGTIISVEDNGTQIPEGKDGAYKKAQDLFKELAGKNKDTVSDVDAVSGATSSSETILAAVNQALEEISSAK